MIRRILAPTLFKFTKMAKEKLKKQESIDISKLNPEFDAFLLYKNPLTKRFKLLSSAFLAYFGFSGALYYYGDEHDRSNQHIIGGIIMAAFLLYQYRLHKTLKNVLLDKRGEKVMLILYRWLGFKEKVLVYENQSMKGIRQFSGWLRVPVIKYEEGDVIRTVTFNSEGILQKDVFRSVCEGKYIWVHDGKPR